MSDLIGEINLVEQKSELNHHNKESLLLSKTSAISYIQDPVTEKVRPKILY